MTLSGNTMIKWVVNVWSALSQLVNAIIGGNPNESISGRSFRLRDHGWGGLYWVINSVFFWQGDHCKDSHFNDVDDCLDFLFIHDEFVLEKDRIVEDILSRRD